MVNYLSKFSARLSELAEPISELSKERVPFNRGPEHDEAFSLIKKEVTAAPILAYYNPNKLMVLQTDAIYPRNRPETFGGHTLQKLKSGHTTTSKNPHQDISVQFQDKIYPRANQPNC